MPIEENDGEEYIEFKRKRKWSCYNCENPIDEFVSWLLTAFSSRNPVMIYSHNGGRYSHMHLKINFKYRFDNHFVLRNLYKRKLSPKLIMTGAKIYQMSLKFGKKYAQLTFRDSYLIMLSPLDSLKATFKLDCEPKPFFPYLWNSKINYDKELDCLPPISYYSPNTMMPKKRQKFIEWYNNNQQSPFSLKKALKEYCENDTSILLAAVLKMREILIGITGGYDAMLKASTIAGIAMNIFRHLFLKSKQLAIVPELGYEKVDKASDKAIKYMEWIAKRDNVKVQHAGNGREKKIQMMNPLNGNTWAVKVDGYIEESDTVIEFLGWYILINFKY